MQQNQEKEPFADLRQSANILLLVLMAMTVSLEVFTRRRFGARYFHFQTLIAFIGIPMWMTFWPGENSTPLLVFWGLYLVMMVRARVESMWVARRGLVGHSRYNGIPRLMTLLKRVPESTVKGLVEPLLGFLAGGALTTISPPLGSYVMSAAAAMAVCQAILRSLEDARARDLHDSLIEQQLHMELFHDLRDRGRY